MFVLMSLTELIRGTFQAERLRFSMISVKHYGHRRWMNQLENYGNINIGKKNSILLKFAVRTPSTAAAHWRRSAGAEEQTPSQSCAGATADTEEHPHMNLWLFYSLDENNFQQKWGNW